MLQLYASARGPQIEPFYAHTPTPASAYALQEQLRKAYRDVLLHWWDIDALIVACFGVRTGKRLRAAEDRLEYKVVELLDGMTPTELEQAAAVFCEQTLVGFVWHVLAQEVSIDYRFKEGDCSTRLCDDKHARAASLGQGQWKRGPHTPPPAPCSCHQSVPALEKEGMHAMVSTTTTAPSTVQSRPAVQTHWYRVKQAQERKRLKRKRR